MTAYTAAIGDGAGYDAVILAEASLLNYWKLDESSGTAAADSKGSSPGVYVGSPTLAQRGPLASAPTGGVLCSGATQKVTVAGISLAPPFSIEGWVYMTAQPSWTVGDKVDIAAWSPSGDLGLNRVAVGGVTGALIGTPAFHANGGADQVYASSAQNFYSSVGFWTHIIGTTDASGNLVIYVNGAQGNTGAGTPITTLTNLVLAIPTSGAGYFSRVALYNAVLTASQALTHYQAAGNRAQGANWLARRLVGGANHNVSDGAHGQDGLVNPIPNPKAAVNTTGWGNFNGGASLSGLSLGSFADAPASLPTVTTCARATATLTANGTWTLLLGAQSSDSASGTVAPATLISTGWVKLNASKKYAISVWVKTNSAAGNVNLNIYQRDTRGTYVTATSQATTAATGAWQQLTFAGTAPAGTEYVMAWPGWGMGAQLNGFVFDFRVTAQCMVNEATVAPAYIDGSQPGCVWLGTANASPSLQTALARVAAYPRDVADAAAAVPGLTRSGALGRALADTAAASPAVTRGATPVRALADAAVAVPSLARAAGIARSAANVAAAAPGLTRRLGGARGLSEALGGSNAVTRASGGARALAEALAGGADLLTRATGARRVLGEALSPSNLLTGAFGVLTAAVRALSRSSVRPTLAGNLGRWPSLANSTMRQRTTGASGARATSVVADETALPSVEASLGSG